MYISKGAFNHYDVVPENQEKKRRVKKKIIAIFKSSGTQKHIFIEFLMYPVCVHTTTILPRRAFVNRHQLPPPFVVLL